MVSQSLRMTDGVSGADIVFEKRLDKILFAPPNIRRDFIKENMNDMTPGFIEYIQQELKATEDSDSKVVLASILQMIGQVKNQDLLGENVQVLTAADESLGDQFAKKKLSLEDDAVGLMNRNEQILAGLMFSTNDVLEDVLNNLHVIDDDFVSYLQKKIETTTDIEERMGLTSLAQVINTVLERVREAEKNGEVLPEEELSMDQIRTRMQEVQMGAAIDPTGQVVKKKEEFAVQADPKETFQVIMKKFYACFDSGMDIPAAVEENYDLCDYTFMNMLKEEADVCFAEGADIEGQQYLDILEAINKAMAKSVEKAQEKLQRILGKGNPKAMESELVVMARRGEVDEALILLIEANAQQAKAAGAIAAAEVLGQLFKRAREETERKLPEEQKLLRALMRINEKDERKGLLYEAFRPTKSLSAEGEVSQGPPLIAPPAFIKVVKQLIQNFGNADSFNIMGRALDIVSEAETVATELYGESMTPRMQQEYMFKKQTVSVWDLGNFEDYAMISGEEIPWGNDKYDNKNPEDVLGEKQVKKIGGVDSDI